MLRQFLPFDPAQVNGNLPLVGLLTTLLHELEVAGNKITSQKLVPLFQFVASTVGGSGFHFCPWASEPLVYEILRLQGNRLDSLDRRTCCFEMEHMCPVVNATVDTAVAQFHE